MERYPHRQAQGVGEQHGDEQRVRRAKDQPDRLAAERGTPEPLGDGLGRVKLRAVPGPGTNRGVVSGRSASSFVTGAVVRPGAGPRCEDFELEDSKMWCWSWSWGHGDELAVTSWLIAEAARPARCRGSPVPKMTDLDQSLRKTCQTSIEFGTRGSRQCGLPPRRSPCSGVRREIGRVLLLQALPHRHLPR